MCDSLLRPIRLHIPIAHFVVDVDHIIKIERQIKAWQRLRECAKPRQAVGRPIGVTDIPDPAMAKFVQVRDHLTHRTDVIGVDVIALGAGNEKGHRDASRLPS